MQRRPHNFAKSGQDAKCRFLKQNSQLRYQLYHCLTLETLTNHITFP